MESSAKEKSEKIFCERCSTEMYEKHCKKYAQIAGLNGIAVTINVKVLK